MRLFFIVLALFALAAQAQSEFDDPAPRGVLVPFGGYPSVQPGAAIVALKDGTVFSYGAGPAVHEFKTLAYQQASLRERRGLGNSSAPNSGPKWYDTARSGWHRLPEPPECKVGARYLHTATALADGNVLIAGGMCDVPKMGDDSAPQQAFAPLSLWDSVNHGWLPAPALAQPRIFHSASLMADGSVIFAGGESDPALAPEQVLSAVERYAKGTMTTLPPMLRARAKHTATVMANGELLVVGGFDATGAPLASAELFNPAQQSWQALPAPKVARYGHSATLLDDGRVMVTGGLGADDKPIAATEVWDPRTQTWSASADLPTPLFGHGAARVASGDVLVAGGAWINGLGRRIPWAWRWNPHTGQWLLAGSAQPKDEATMSSPVLLAPQAAGDALVFTPAAVMRWFPDAAANGASDAGFIFDKVLAESGAAKVVAQTPAKVNAAPGFLSRFAGTPEVRQRVLIALGASIILFIALRGRFAGVLRYGVPLAVFGVLLWLLLPKPAAKVPCGLVGVWSARNDGDHAVREVELKDDGSYTMGASQLGNDPPGGYQGRWSVTGATMSWRDENGQGEADDNPMEQDAPGHFVLTERNHSHTEFTLERVSSTSCKQ